MPPQSALSGKTRILIIIALGIACLSFGMNILLNTYHLHRVGVATTAYFISSSVAGHVSDYQYGYRDAAGHSYVLHLDDFELPHGGNINILYDPANPEDAAANSPLSWIIGGILVLFGLLLIAFAIVRRDFILRSPR